MGNGITINGKTWKLLGLITAVLAAGWAIWQWQPAGVDSSPEAKRHTPQHATQSPPAAPDQAPPTLKTHRTGPGFARNRALDANIGNFRPTGDVQLVLSNPALDAAFSPDADGLVTIPFSGGLSGKEDLETVNLILVLFSNKGSSQSLAEVPVELQKDGAGRHILRLDQHWTLKPGLYYFMIETEDGDMMGGGRFEVQI